MTNRTIIIIAVALIAVLAILVNTILQEHSLRARLDKAIQALDSDDPGALAGARTILDEHRNRALPLLVNATTDRNETRRANAVNVLGTFAPYLTEKQRAEAVKAISTRLNDIDPQVRKAAVLALTRDFKHGPCSDSLQTISGADADVEVRMAALTGLGCIGGTEETQFLVKKLDSKDDHIVVAASHGLGLTGRADALRALLKALKSKRGLAIHTEQLIAVAALAGDLKVKGGALNGEVIDALDELFRKTNPDTLRIQGHVDMAGGLASPEPWEFLLTLLNAYHEWGHGEKIKLFFERIGTTTGEERRMYEDAVSKFIYNMLTEGLIRGEEIKVVVEMSEADTKLMLFISKELIDLIETESRDFALKNLRAITRLNFGGDVVRWREQYEKWATGREKFKVEPLK